MYKSMMISNSVNLNFGNNSLPHAESPQDAFRKFRRHKAHAICVLFTYSEGQVRLVPNKRGELIPKDHYKIPASELPWRLYNALLKAEDSGRYVNALHAFEYAICDAKTKTLNEKPNNLEQEMERFFVLQRQVYSDIVGLGLGEIVDGHISIDKDSLQNKNYKRTSGNTYSYNPSAGRVSTAFGVSAEPFEFERQMKGVVKLEQNASYLPGGAWPMEVILHYEDGSRHSWRGKLFGTVEQFCIDHAPHLVFISEQQREKIIVTGVDGFQRPLFPASMDYQSTLQACLTSALLQQELDWDKELSANPDDFSSPQQRRDRGLRPHYSAEQSYGTGNRLMHGVIPMSANDSAMLPVQELKNG